MAHGTGIRVFISYSHEDAPLTKRLLEHLSPLRRRGVISDWYDRKIPPGEDWREEIDDHLEEASLILLLISSAFMQSDYCYAIEGKRALERDESGDARVIPIMLRQVDVEDTPVARLQMLPERGRPVTSWQNRDEAFKSIVDGIKAAIADMTGSMAEISRAGAASASRHGDASVSGVTQRSEETAARSSQISAERLLLQRLRAHQNDLERLVSAQLALLEVEEAVQLIEAWRDDPQKLDANPAIKHMIADHLDEIGPLVELLKRIDTQLIDDDQYRTRVGKLVEESAGFDAELGKIHEWSQRVIAGGGVAPIPDTTVLHKSLTSIADKFAQPSKRLVDELRGLIDRFSDIEDLRVTGTAPVAQTFAVGTAARGRDRGLLQRSPRSPLGVQGT
ncbi:MAG TPA: toll/interleukin-1 receptor domain-containing protein [Gaiellaceae bacterium]|nr:toll/interleukin-1 receptor domain-containing protein [Gaiellaceae bacterium]